MRTEHDSSMESEEVRMIRWMCGVSSREGQRRLGNCGRKKKV